MLNESILRMFIVVELFGIKDEICVGAKLLFMRFIQIQNFTWLVFINGQIKKKYV